MTYMKSIVILLAHGIRQQTVNRQFYITQKLQVLLHIDFLIAFQGAVSTEGQAAVGHNRLVAVSGLGQGIAAHFRQKHIVLKDQHRIRSA